MALNAKQSAFVREYLKDSNATQAAMRAGYSKKTAYSQGHDLLKKPEVMSAIQAKQEKIQERVELSVEKVLADLQRIAAKAEAAEEYHPAAKCHELLGKHLKMFTEKHELSGPAGKSISISIGGIAK